jgi:hypothetical protein
MLPSGAGTRSGTPRTRYVWLGVAWYLLGMAVDRALLRYHESLSRSSKARRMDCLGCRAHFFSPDCGRLKDPVSARPSLMAHVPSLTLRKRIDFRICQAATHARLVCHTLLV